MALLNKENLDKSVAKFTEISNLTDTRRAEWNNNTKKYLIETLNSVASSYPLTLNVQPKNAYVNYESVQLKFRDDRSGIREVNTGNFLMKLGGYLSFSQSYNGTVIIAIGYPEIETITKSHNHKVIGITEPSDINEELVVKSATDFFEEMIKWEQDINLIDANS